MTFAATDAAKATTITDRLPAERSGRPELTEAQIVELTAAIALENFRSKFNPTLGVEAQGFCMVPTATTARK